MSILVEGITVIVPRSVLDISWPGGTDAYLEAARQPDHPCRYAIADDVLTAVSFYEATHVYAHLEILQRLGVLVDDDEESGEACVVDQEHGPFSTCEWLEWELHDAGFTHAWKAGSGAGDMVMVWDGWTPETSRELTRVDIREEPGAAIRLAREADGTETWLNLLSGEVWSCVVSEEESAVYDLLRELSQ